MIPSPSGQEYRGRQAWRPAPILAPEVSNTGEMPGQMDRVTAEGGYLREGQLVVFLAGQP